MKHWLLLAALVCFGSTAQALSVRPAAAGSEANTYTSTKTFTDTVSIKTLAGPTTFISSVTIRGGATALGFLSGASSAAINFSDGDYNLNIFNTPNVAVNDFVYNGIRLFNGGDSTTPKWVFERTGPLNIGNAVPAATKLDVNGSAQFGSGVTRSTFSTTGALTLASGAALTASGANGNIVGASSITTTSGLFGQSLAIAGSTLTVTGTGIVSAPSNPWAISVLPSQNITPSVYTKMFFFAPGTGGGGQSGQLFGGTASSGTWTVPAGGTGLYALHFNYVWSSAANIVVKFKKNGGDFLQCTRINTIGAQVVDCLRWTSLTAADYIEVFVYQDAVTTTIGGGGIATDSFTMKKEIQ